VSEPKRLVPVDLQQAGVPRVDGYASLQQHAVDGHGADRPKPNHSTRHRNAANLLAGSLRYHQFGHAVPGAEHIPHDVQRLLEPVFRDVGDIEDDLAFLLLHIERRPIGETIDLRYDKPELVADPGVLDLLAATVGDNPARLSQVPRQPPLVHQAEVVPNGALRERDALFFKLRGDGARANGVVGIGDDSKYRE
jgi:hypothetical protein